MILAKLDRKDKHLKSRSCVSCKKVKMSLKACWHNEVNILLESKAAALVAADFIDFPQNKCANSCLNLMLSYFKQ